MTRKLTKDLTFTELKNELKTLENTRVAEETDEIKVLADKGFKKLSAAAFAMNGG